MQCPACRAVYSNGLDICPRCKTPAYTPAIETDSATPDVAVATSASVEASKTVQSEAPASTLIEFPGARSMPQWRKQLSERVREIQERRAREAAREAEEMARNPVAQPAAVEADVPPLGLVPPPEVPEMNPIVVAALRRIERARQPQTLPPVSRSSRGGAAVARVAEEQYQEELNPTLATGLIAPPEAEQAPATKPIETPREHNLVVVPAPQPVKEERPVKASIEREIEVGIDEASAAELETKRETELGTLEDLYDDRAPVVARLTAGLIDFLVVAFASSPFAAIIELTNGNWSDPRVAASMGGIVLLVMFLYLTTATAIAGRTWGMSLLSLRAVDVDSGEQPTTKQAMTRALIYMISLAALGLGIVYALFDAEGRTAHDHISGTAVVLE